MPKKTKIDLLTELPVLIKSKGLVSPTKTTGDSLREMLRDIIDSMAFDGEGVPEGGIIEWYGSIASIPIYWALCDGNNGTPDLRNKFVIGAGGLYTPNATGGSDTHTHTGTVGSHVLTVDEIPKHKHSVGNKFVQSDGDESGSDSNSIHFEGGSEIKTSTFTRFTEDNSSSNLGHSHPLTINSTVTLPPYHALAFIMFKGVSFVPDTTPPSNVVNLLVYSITTTSFDISWNASTDNVAVLGYDIYIDGNYLDTTSSLSYSVTGLNPSTSYSVVVRSRDAQGNVSPNTSSVATTNNLPVVIVSYPYAIDEGITFCNGGSTDFTVTSTFNIYSDSSSWGNFISVYEDSNLTIPYMPTSDILYGSTIYQSPSGQINVIGDIGDSCF